MDKKRLLIYGALLAVLLLLMYMQFRTWRHFDWATFLNETHHVSKRHLLHAISLIYLAYAIRAFRWKIFLQPMRKTTTAQMLAPTLIGFTGLALLGRPGELIRPYLISRRVNMPFSSQLGVWAVERIFDIAAFTVLLVLTAFVATAPKRLDTYELFQKVGLAFSLLTVGLIVGAVAVYRRGEALAGWVERRFAHLSANLGKRIALRLREFHSGLNTIGGIGSLLALAGLSIGMWAMIAVAYKEVTHAYAVEHLEIPQTQVLLLMGSSMVGSMIQLPAVGGGSQLATISTLVHVFDVPQELAASCGIMLWLVTFIAVIPAGLLLAHRERLSLRKLSQESQEEEAHVSMTPSSPS
jgi:uncharacterized protein (TIRG00374 family)